ncbi:hypothetical protein Bbelb_236780 [Branchiostoma belcheri]|nr:hypothetical protein Bbelb_236780 [Branchiostoma belcheri]
MGRNCRRGPTGRGLDFTPAQFAVTSRVVRVGERTVVCTDEHDDTFLRLGRNSLSTMSMASFKSHTHPEQGQWRGPKEPITVGRATSTDHDPAGEIGGGKTTYASNPSSLRCGEGAATAKNYAQPITDAGAIADVVEAGTIADVVEAGAIADVVEAGAIADVVRDEAEARAGVKYHTFQAVSYKKQVVAGINYFIKVGVGTEYCVHLKVYRGFRNNVSLSDVQLEKNIEDPIEYF